MGGTKMSGFASEEYNSCKTWIAAQIQAGATSGINIIQTDFGFRHIRNRSFLIFQ